MKSSIYKKAAEKIVVSNDKHWLFLAENKDLWKYACHAIEEASNYNGNYYQAFEDYFCPINKSEPNLNPWWDRNGQRINKETQLARQLALLFMAEIVEDK